VGFNPLVQKNFKKTTSTQAQPPRKIPSDEGMTIFFLAQGLGPGGSYEIYLAGIIAVVLSLTFFFGEKTNGSKTIKKNNKHPSTTAKEIPSDEGMTIWF